MSPWEHCQTVAVAVIAKAERDGYESGGHFRGTVFGHSLRVVSVVKLSKNFFLRKIFYSVSKLSKKTICYSVSGVSTQLRNRVNNFFFYR